MDNSIIEILNYYITNILPLAWAVLIIAFVVLAKCAGIFVDCVVGLAYKLKIPTLVISIVLVSLSTTTPELAVSLISAIRGNPEMALGNAVGSVICDDGLALGLAGALTLSPIAVIPRLLKSSAFFLVCVDVVAFLFVLPDYTLSRWEGAVLVVLFLWYIGFLFTQYKKGRFRAQVEIEGIEKISYMHGAKVLGLFILVLAGIIISSELIITSASTIARRQLGIPDAVIALTLVAFGTSIPEVATCVAATRKKQGAVAVGNILGADILNICWVAGASAVANNLTLQAKEIYFMFPSMFIIVGAMLIMLRYGHNLTRKKGILLLALYLIYLVSFFILYAPSKTIAS